MAVIEGVARLLPGVVGNPVSTETESFRSGLLEEPQYTRPAEYRGWAVPEVLLSGDHGRIERWREQQRIERTAQRRPDLDLLDGVPRDGHRGLPREMGPVSDLVTSDPAAALLSAASRRSLPDERPRARAEPRSSAMTSPTSGRATPSRCT